VEISNLEGDLLFDSKEVGFGSLQFDLLKGTIRARSVIDLKPELPVLSAAFDFSNLDMAMLIPSDARGGGDSRDAELTGEFALELPLVPKQRELFEGAKLKANIRKIGANTLERALFSLDPYERNEQLVSQRKMLRHGTLKSLRATALDGAFSIEGEAQVKGVDISVPKVERIRLSELPLRKETASAIAGIAAARKGLDLLRGDMLYVGPKGEIALRRRSDAK
jgi:hypothetical protein